MKPSNLLSKLINRQGNAPFRVIIGYGHIKCLFRIALGRVALHLSICKMGVRALLTQSNASSVGLGLWTSGNCCQHISSQTILGSTIPVIYLHPINYYMVTGYLYEFAT